MTSTSLLRASDELLAEMRRRAPLVHCITNLVVNNFTANVLLAAGASPAMIPDPGEAGVFAGIASALLVNVGTVTPELADAMRAAVAGARAAGRPWVLDPVAVGALPLRTNLSRELLATPPAIIRGNASEIPALAGEAVTNRGTDATQGVEAAAGAARRLAAQTGGAVLVTGPTDLAVGPDGREARIGGGTPLLTRVTGVGCAQGAICAAFCAAADGDAFLAAVASALLFAVAGERAEKVSSRPGSFQIALLDAFDAIAPGDFSAEGSVHVIR